MQGKALTALATLLAALVLAACGGGDDGSETSAGGAETAPAAGQAQLRERADEIEKERQGESGGAEAGAREEQSGDGSGPGGAGSRGDGPDPSPPAEHSDSGGGAAQFRGSKGGDDSIQEFGQEAGGSELARAAAVLHAYLDARAARRWDDACSYLSAGAVAGIEQFAEAFAQDQDVEGCPEVLGTLSERTSDEALREGAQADVGSLRAQGGRGFLLYHGARGVDYAIAVVEEGGEWKIAAPEATPLP